MNNLGDLNAVLRDVTSSKALRGYFIDGVTAGVLKGIGERINAPMAPAQDAGTRPAQTSTLRSFGDHLQAQLLRQGVRAPLNVVIGQQKFSHALETAVRGTVADTMSGYMAEQIGAGYDDLTHKSILDVVTHKVLHGLNGAVTGAILTGEKGMIPGAVGAMVAESAAEMMMPNRATIEARVKAGEDRTVIKKEVERIADVARMAAATVALMTDQDVNVAIHTATNAVENNFCLALTLRPKENTTADDPYEEPTKIEMSVEQQEALTTQVEQTIQLMAAHLGRPLNEREYESVVACALDRFCDDGAGQASGYALLNVPKIPGVLVREGLARNALTTPETANAIGTGVDAFVMLLSSIYGAGAGASYMRSLTSGVAPALGKNITGGLIATEANLGINSSLIPQSHTNLLAAHGVPNAGGYIKSFVTTQEEIYYRVYTHNKTGAYFTKIPPKNSVFAQEGLALPSSNMATYIQEVIVPAGTRLQRSRALSAFDKRGGLEQFQILDRKDLSKIIFKEGKLFND